MDCDVCFLPFAISGPQEPKVLECGHTFCSNCVGFFNNQCATCRQRFRTTKTNFTLVQLLNGKADSAPSRNEVEERKRELGVRKRQELNNQLLSIKISIGIAQEEKSLIDNEVNDLREKLRNLERTSHEKQTEIDRLSNDSLNLEKQLRGNLAGGASSSNPSPGMYGLEEVDALDGGFDMFGPNGGGGSSY